MTSICKAIALAVFALGVIVLQAGTAHATDGWYVRGDVGYSIDGEIDFNDPYGSDDLDNDWMASGGGGYGFSNGIRLEGELAYRNNSASRSDEVDARALMANVYYDFNREGRVAPYIGAGAGYARVHADDLGSDSGVAYQAMVGVGVRVTPQLTVDIGYRYFKVPNLDYKATGHRTVQVYDEGDDGEGYCPKNRYNDNEYYYPEEPQYTEVSEPYSYGVEGDYVHQAITLGVRYQFAAPAAPAPAPMPVAPPAPVAVCPRSDFVVYFEWDRDDLNAQALDVIDNAVTRARECNMSAAAIVGHTDTSGSIAYNAALSERRAAVVRDALAARGVAVSMMTTEARGESDLAQATADGVREPLNRRTAVTITFQ